MFLIIDKFVELTFQDICSYLIYCFLHQEIKVKDLFPKAVFGYIFIPQFTLKFFLLWFYF